LGGKESAGALGGRLEFFGCPTERVRLQTWEVVWVKGDRDYIPVLIELAVVDVHNVSGGPGLGPNNLHSGALTY
jgi:hypothetical protein